MFTQKVFIRKNTPELMTKLVAMGRVPFMIDVKLAINDDPKQRENHCNVLTCINDYFALCSDNVGNHYKTGEPTGEFIECAENEEGLFLSLASLRDDSDFMQWFTDGDSWFLSKYVRVMDHIHYEMDGWDTDGFHKATPEELINHFRK